MEYSNFQMIEKQPGNESEFAEVDVTSGWFRWKKVQRKRLGKGKYGAYWRWLDTGDFVPSEVENMASAWAIQNGK
jgi:hypothetical protein